MNKKIIIAVIIIVIIIGAWMFWSNQGTTNTANYGTTQNSVTENTNQSVGTSTNTTVTLMVSTGQLFSSSQFFRNAYEVYPTLDPTNGSRALSGFAIQTQNLGSGATHVTLVAKQVSYHTQSFIIGSGQTLYFIERSFGDDSNDQDINYGDDSGIAVDARGYILQ
jgi:hypothetical protein